MSYYDILNVNKSASLEDIKKSFRNIAKKVHPDKGGDQKEFILLNEAYETLIDIDKRKEYDLKLNQIKTNNLSDIFFSKINSPINIGPISISPNGVSIDIKQIFKNMNVNLNRTPTRLPDIYETLNIPLVDCFNDVKQEVYKTINQICQTCNLKCVHCDGQGVSLQPFKNQRFEQVLNPSMISPCIHCKSTGYLLNKKDGCKCKDGNILFNTCLVIDIPKHIIKNAQIQFANMGKQSTKYLEISSNLFINIVIDKPRNVEIQNFDIIYSPQVSIKDMITGIILDISHITKDCEFSIPPFSLNPQIEFVVKGMGLYQTNTSRGDIIIKPIINYDFDFSYIDNKTLCAIFDKK